MAVIQEHVSLIYEQFAQIIKLYLQSNERKIRIKQNKEADCFMLTSINQNEGIRSAPCGNDDILCLLLNKSALKINMKLSWWYPGSAATPVNRL